MGHPVFFESAYPFGRSNFTRFLFHVNLRLMPFAFGSYETATGSNNTPFFNTSCALTANRNKPKAGFSFRIASLPDARSSASWTVVMVCFLYSPQSSKHIVPYRFAVVKHFSKKKKTAILCGFFADITRTLRGHFADIFTRFSFNSVHDPPNLHYLSCLPSRQIRIILDLQCDRFSQFFRICHFPCGHFEAFRHSLILPILYRFLELINPVSPLCTPSYQFFLNPNALAFDNIDKSGEKHWNNVHCVVYDGERYPLRCLCYALHKAIF